MSLAVIRFCSRLRAVAALDLLDAAVERGGQGVPEMEEGVLLEADVDEHRLEAVLDVFDAALENEPTMLRSLSRSMEYSSRTAVFEQRDAAFEPFGIDDEFVAGLARGQADHAFDAFGHGKEFGVKLGEHWG